MPKYEWLLSDEQPKQIAGTLDEETWTGLLSYLQDTVDTIPISTLDPDPWDCVSNLIKALQKKLSAHG